MPKTTQLRALKGFQYSEKLSVRSSINKGQNVAFAERFPWVYVEQGNLFTPPGDLRESLLVGGIAEEVIDDGS